MSRDLQLYLADILVACEKVLRYTEDMEFGQLIADDRTFDAVIRDLQMIGEAVKNVPDDVRDCLDSTLLLLVISLQLNNTCYEPIT